MTAPVAAWKICTMIVMMITSTATVTSISTRVTPAAVRELPVAVAQLRSNGTARSVFGVCHGSWSLVSATSSAAASLTDVATRNSQLTHLRTTDYRTVNCCGNTLTTYGQIRAAFRSAGVAVGVHRRAGGGEERPRLQRPIDIHDHRAHDAAWPVVYGSSIAGVTFWTWYQ